MQRVLRMLADERAPRAVFFLTALPIRLARPLLRVLRHDHYPAGHGADGRAAASSPGWFLGGGLATKRAVLDRLAAGAPGHDVVLVGDDAGHDPAALRRLRPRPPGAGRGDRAAPARRRRRDDQEPAGRPATGAPRSSRPRTARSCCPGCAPRWGSARRAASRGPRTGSSRAPSAATRRPGCGRGPRATRCACACTAAPTTRALAERLAATGAGDLVLFAGLARRRRPGARATADRRSPTSLAGAARRGARVRGLLWRSHLEVFGYHVAQNRRLASDAPRGRRRGAARPADPAARQPPPEARRHPARRDPADDVAYVGGIDLVLGARDDIVHRGDPQSAASGDEYTRSPRHDAQLELRGPVVRDLQDVFAERWDDPAPLVRLPWHVVPDRLHGLPRRGSPLPDPAPGPAAGRAVRGPDPAHLPPPAARRTRSPPAASAASPARSSRRWAGRSGWSTSRTSTCGPPTSRACSPPRCAGPRSCT